MPLSFPIDDKMLANASLIKKPKKCEKRCAFARELCVHSDA